MATPAQQEQQGSLRAICAQSVECGEDGLALLVRLDVLQHEQVDVPHAELTLGQRKVLQHPLR